MLRLELVDAHDTLPEETATSHLAVASCSALLPYGEDRCSSGKASKIPQTRRVNLEELYTPRRMVYHGRETCAIFGFGWLTKWPHQLKIRY